MAFAFFAIILNNVLCHVVGQEPVSSTWFCFFFPRLFTNVQRGPCALAPAGRHPTGNRQQAVMPGGWRVVAGQLSQ